MVSFFPHIVDGRASCRPERLRKDSYTHSTQFFLTHLPTAFRSFFLFILLFLFYPRIGALLVAQQSSLTLSTPIPACTQHASKNRPSGLEWPLKTSPFLFLVSSCCHFTISESWSSCRHKDYHSIREETSEHCNHGHSNNYSRATHTKSSLQS